MRYNNKKKYIIEKQDTTTTTNNTSDYYNNTTTDDVYTDDYDEYYSETEDVTSTVNQTTSMQKTTNEERVVYNSIMNTGYKKPKSGSKQDNFTKEEILKKLENYIPLKSIQDKKILERLPLFKTWIRYYNTKTKQFRIGGLLMKVVYPDYIMLINTAQNLTWSVQLKDNIIYMPDPRRFGEIQQKKQKENLIKDKLLDMYKRGQLTTKK
jgi:hypothetical protein